MSHHPTYWAPRHAPPTSPREPSPQDGSTIFRASDVKLTLCPARCLVNVLLFVRWTFFQVDIFILPVLQIRKLGIRQVSCLPRGTQWSVSTQLGCFPKFLFLMAILIGTDFFFFFSPSFGG